MIDKAIMVTREYRIVEFDSSLLKKNGINSKLLKKELEQKYIDDNYKHPIVDLNYTGRQLESLLSYKSNMMITPNKYGDPVQQANEYIKTVTTIDKLTKIQQNIIAQLAEQYPIEKGEPDES